MNRLLFWSAALLLLYGFSNFKTDFLVKDHRDGQEYPVTTIGHLTIMAENLAFDHPAAYCYQDKKQFCTHYGKLYDYATAIGQPHPDADFVQGICPDGWHIPSVEEWDYILRGLQGKAIAKRPHFLSFQLPKNLLRLKFSGFKSHEELRYYQLGQRGFYMSSSTHDGKWTTVEIKRNGLANLVALHSKTPKERAISCRCIKNE